MSEVTSVKVPLALQELILANNDKLRQHQEALFNQVQQANKEMMELLKLNPEDGWRLDISQMTYVKLSPDELKTEE